jgi:hypothetical protein
MITPEDAREPPAGAAAQDGSDDATPLVSLRPLEKWHS